jgi:hypothetical protein
MDCLCSQLGFDMTTRKKSKKKNHSESDWTKIKGNELVMYRKSLLFNKETGEPNKYMVANVNGPWSI